MQVAWVRRIPKGYGTNIVALGADVIIMRHSSSGSADVSKTVNTPIINAGDGSHSPHQALLDTFTLTEHLRDVKKKVILGDTHSVVWLSNIHCLRSWGLRYFSGSKYIGPKEFEAMGVWSRII